NGPYDGELVAADLPDMVAPGSRAHVVVKIKNTGSETWHPDPPLLGTAAPMARDSALYDPDNWVAPHRVATVSAETKSGETGEFDFTILASHPEQGLTETCEILAD